MELLCISLPTLDIIISEAILNHYFWLKEKFRFSSSLQSFMFQNFMTNTAKVRNGHFWTILNKFCVFLFLKGLNEIFFWAQFVRNCSPKCLETIIILSYQKYFKLRIKFLSLYNELNFEITCFKIGCTICILKFCEFYLNSKYFYNQNISQDSRISVEFSWYIIFRISFVKLGRTSEKR